MPRGKEKAVEKKLSGEEAENHLHAVAEEDQEGDSVDQEVDGEDKHKDIYPNAREPVNDAIKTRPITSVAFRITFSSSLKSGFW